MLKVIIELELEDEALTNFLQDWEEIKDLLQQQAGISEAMIKMTSTIRRIKLPI